MTMLLNSYVNALLADAAYRDVFHGVVRSDLIDILKNSLTLTQATYVAENFEVINSENKSDVPLVGSGFDAVVWRGKAGGAFAGQVFVSIRGTEPPLDAAGADLLADGDLTFNSGARSQTIDMVNWWLRETAPAGAQVAQVKWDPLRVPNPAQPASVIPGSVEIEGVNTFNSAGYNRIDANELFQEFQAVIGAGTNDQTISALQKNLYASNGVNFTTNNLWFAQVGQRIGLNQEEGTGLPNHFMDKPTDMLTGGWGFAGAEVASPTLLH